MWIFVYPPGKRKAVASSNSELHFQGAPKLFPDLGEVLSGLLACCVTEDDEVGALVGSPVVGPAIAGDVPRPFVHRPLRI